MVKPFAYSILLPILVVTVATANDLFGVNQALGLSSPPPRTAIDTATATESGVPLLPQQEDYQYNLESDVFGAQLFTGAFAAEEGTPFNPDYVIHQGDRVQLRMWGGFEIDTLLDVDLQGNIFIPHVGPVKLQGVANRDLQQLVEKAIKRTFKANVFSYVTLAAAQPLQVYVGGYVNRPGAYGGTSMDSVLYYLDKAGGIDTERGTFLDIQIKRGNQIRAKINLYDFLVNGVLPHYQLRSGDVIFVPPRQKVVQVTGLVENPKQFEFKSSQFSLDALLSLARPEPVATHIRITRNSGMTTNVDYLPLEGLQGSVVYAGDVVAVTADKKAGTISVRVEGAHNSPQEYVLPSGTLMGELLAKIEFNSRSDLYYPQLFRHSVAERQKESLNRALDGMETRILTTRSGSSAEAELRKNEAELILRWIQLARDIEPKGQVVIARSSQLMELPLESGDIIRIPTKDGLVLVSGEVLYPNAIAYDAVLGLDDYIDLSGGYSQSADTSRIVIAHSDGSFSTYSDSGKQLLIKSGDEVMVLPRVELKSRQFWKDMMQIIYQVAISAKVVLDL
ncbi:polysaccharide export protein [Ectothiorhodospiraceae bacterium BW-2]|nr:polysaccharide export protein [Ectothiorhodospiraceae bacterium BW-2]